MAGGKGYSSDQLLALNQPSTIRAILVSINIPTPLRYALYQSPITWDSEVYWPRSMKIMEQQIRGPLDSKRTCTIGDGDKEVSAALYAEGGFGTATCTMIELVEYDGAWVEIYTHDWEIKTVEFVPPSVLVHCESGAGLNSRLGLIIGTITCPWVFKGDRCQYVSGETVCDRSEDDCNDNKSNLSNFGGLLNCPEPGSSISFGASRSSGENRNVNVGYSGSSHTSTPGAYWRLVNGTLVLMYRGEEEEPETPPPTNKKKAKRYP